MSKVTTPRMNAAARKYNKLYPLGATIKVDPVLEEGYKLELELAALKRGEFICSKCGLRKDAEHEEADF